MANSERCRKRMITSSRRCLALLIATLYGCSNIHCCFSYESETESGTKVYIFGLGLVTLPATHGHEDILVAQSQSLGISFSNQPGIQASLGYMNSSIVSVPANTDSITEVKTCPINDQTINIEVLKQH